MTAQCTTETRTLFDWTCVKKKAKKFDCVAMKRAGAARIYRKIRGMTIQQQLEFWRQASEELRREQEAAKARKLGGAPRKTKQHVDT
jgi:hypothetical protein